MVFLFGQSHFRKYRARFDKNKRGRNQQEIRDIGDGERIESTDARNVFIRNLSERKIIDEELSLFDQIQKHIERPLELFGFYVMIYPCFEGLLHREAIVPFSAEKTSKNASVEAFLG
jgi:hypothetical protein